MIKNHQSILRIINRDYDLEDIDPHTRQVLSHLATILRKRLCIIFAPQTIIDSEWTQSNLVCYDPIDKKVKEISLNNERIQKNLDFFSIFKHIRALRFQRCHLRDLPAWFSSFHFLEFLDLTNNKLKNLPSSLLSLKKLNELNLSFNNFQFLPSWVEQFTSLHFLHIEGNPFEAIPWCVRKYDRETFNISLIEWEESFRLTGQLRYLMMSMKIQDTNNRLLSNNHMVDYHGIFQWVGDSEDIWLQTIEDNSRRSDEMPMDTFMKFLAHLMCVRSDLILASITYKIKENIPLDILEITHPDLPKWRSIIEKTYDQFRTEVGKIILNFINDVQQIELSNFMILL